MMHFAKPWLLAAILLLSTVNVHAQSVTRATFKVIEKVQVLMEEDRFKEALTEVELLATEMTDTPYDYAIANQYIAHLSILLDDPQRARTALEAALAVPDLPLEAQTDLYLFYGTVLLGDEEYELARGVLDKWLAATPDPLPTQVFSVAYANYMSGNLVESEPLIARAIARKPQPPESWYQLYYRILFELRKFDAAEEVVRGLVARNPSSKQHWRLLASHFLQLERGEEGLAAIMIAYSNGLIVEEKTLEQIVSLYNYMDAPEKGARLLQDWIEDEKLPGDADHLKQLGSLWLLARERENAKVALRNAAKLTADGRTYELLGGIYFEDEAWPEAYEAYDQAISIGGLEEPLRVSLLAGISAFRAGQHADAKRSLKVAAESDEFRPQAQSLLNQIE